MSIYVAGLDRSGTPDQVERRAGREVYVVGFAALDCDLEVIRSTLADLRRTCGKAEGEEFHGRDDPEWMQATVLGTALSLGLRVAVAVHEKGATLPDGEAPWKTAQFQADAALNLWEKFVRRYQFGRLWCDEDIQGKAQQKAFETSLGRRHREAWPNTRVKTRHIASKSSDLVQLADLVVYGFSRLARGLVRSRELRQILARVQAEPGNVFIGPLPWGELK